MNTGRSIEQSSVSDKINYIHLLSVPGITEKAILDLLNHFQTPQKIFGSKESELVQLGISQNLAARIISYDKHEEVKRRLDMLVDKGVRILLISDPDYPSWLHEVTLPPPLLFVYGELKEEDQNSIGVVGTRRASSYGRATAEYFSKKLASSGLTIVSGLARGIDTVAHKAAIEVGGRTVAFLGCGIDIFYPPENRKLYKRIAENGAVISEFPPGTPPWKKNFIKRNRLIPAFSRAIIAVEAPEKSGVLNTVSWAGDMGKDVMAVPGNIFERRSQGTNRLIKDGAIPVTNPEEVLEYLKIPVAEKEAEKIELDGEEEKILKHIGLKPKHVDDIAMAACVDTKDLSMVLLSLEMKGAIKQLPGKCYILTRKL